MSSASGTKYSWMSDAEFLRVADGVVGIEVLDEALHRLTVRLAKDVAMEKLYQEQLIGNA